MGTCTAPGSYWPDSGDVWIDPENASDTDWNAGTSYNFEALLHEIGHAIGLKHPFEEAIQLDKSWDNRVYTIMSYTDPVNDLYPNAGYVNGQWDWITYSIYPETPMVLDIAAIQYIYGANNSYKTGDDTYTFDPTKPFFKTIWDAGGKDTISVSNFALSCKIDLTPGNYSSLRYPPPTNPDGLVVTYDGTNNLGIAFNCIIENVIGGSGNDTVIGNSANNNIDGGPGNDIMYGGTGNDTFDWSSSKRSGNDTMYGGMGDDVYVLDSIGDSVVEYANEGKDTIWVSFSHSIAALLNIENLYGIGSNSLSLTGNSAANYLDGGSGGDVIDGGAGKDSLNGLGGNDLLIGGQGDDEIIGGLGVDTAQFSGTSASYSISASKSKTTVIDKRLNSDGSDSLSGVERLKFSDKSIAIDLDGNAGTSAKIIGAVLGKEAVKIPAFMGIGLSLLDGGMSYSDLGALALAAVGATTNESIGSTVWRNIYGTNPTANELSSIVKQLNNGLKPGDYIVSVGDSALNATNIGLVGLALTGIEFLPT